MRLQVQFVLDASFKLDDLLKLELHKFADEVGEIVDCAQKEEKMEQGLAKLKVIVFCLGALSLHVQPAMFSDSRKTADNFVTMGSSNSRVSFWGVQQLQKSLGSLAISLCLWFMYCTCCYNAIILILCRTLGAMWSSSSRSTRVQTFSWSGWLRRTSKLWKTTKFLFR